jgi:hypothetical protein
VLPQKCQHYQQWLHLLDSLGSVTPKRIISNVSCFVPAAKVRVQTLSLSLLFLPMVLAESCHKNATIVNIDCTYLDSLGSKMPKRIIFIVSYSAQGAKVSITIVAVTSICANDILPI